MNNKAIIVLVVAVIVGGLGFYGGTLYAKKGSAVQMSGRGGVGATGGRAGGFAAGLGGRNGGGFAAGDIVSKDATSFTVKLRDGGSKIVFFSASTTVGKMAAGSMDDVSQGTSVTITGTSNADGSVTASMVQIRPSSATATPDTE